MPANPTNAREVFLAAADLSASERSAYLDNACGTDADLRQRVSALLHAHDGQSVGTGDFSPPSPGSLTDGGTVGEHIGPYKLLQRLGEGGMGTVWLAEQSEPVRRKVALKVIKAGMDTALVISRFEAERQALALMDHPNIAKILDAGTTSAGKPYFVMELVKGIPITRYCDQAHLTPAERLQLFIPACQAVQHAHQKGIIHRDLKPSNVIVGLYDGRPVPKIIDFGVAKATRLRLTEKTLFTEVGSIIGTLEYMAPEQAELNNLDIDTRADIYSLGVILYELLAGSPPFSSKQLRSAAFTEMLRVIREVEPPKPSTKLSSSDELPNIAANRHLEPKRLTKFVVGDLDWIVMKCLEKDRGRRYETANGLAVELQRFLANEPVLAGPPGRLYRMRKFVNRNRSAVAAAAVLFSALVLGTVGTAWQAYRAELARRDAVAQTKIADAASAEADAKRIAAQEATARAQTNFRLALDAFNDMVNGIQTKLQTRPETQDLRKELLQKAQSGLKQLLKEAEATNSGDSTLTWTHIRLGDVHRVLGESEKSLKEYQIADDRAKVVLIADPSNVQARRDLSISSERLGNVARQMGNAAKALEHYRQSMEIRQLLASEDPKSAHAQRQLSISFNKLGDVTLQMGNAQGALDYYRQSLEVDQRLASDDPKNAQARRDLSVSFNKLGDVTLRMGNVSGALEFYRESLEMRQQLARDDPKNVEAQSDLSISFNKVGDLTMQLGNAPGALESYRQGLDVRERISRDDPKNAQANRNLYVSYVKLGDVTRQMGDATGTLDYYRRSLELRQPFARDDPKNAQAQRDISVSYARLGDVTLQIGDAASALEFYRKNREICQRLARDDPKNSQAQRDLHLSFQNQGDVMLRTGNVPNAIDLYRESLEVCQRLSRDDPKNAQTQQDLFVALYRLGVAVQQARQFVEARSWYEKARECLERSQLEGWIKKPEQMIGVWSFQRWLDETKLRLAICNKVEQSVKDLDFALKQPANEVSGLLHARLRVLASQGDTAACVATADAMMKLGKKDARGHFSTACLWSLCTAMAKEQGDPPIGAPDEYAAKAMEHLKQAVAAGLKDVGELKLNQDLNALRERNDFKALLTEVESKITPRKPTEEKKP